MSVQLTLPGMCNAIFSPASEDGVTRSDLPDGRMIVPSGPAAVPVNLSASQALAAGLMTRATFGLRGAGSSTTANLQRSLASRLQALTDGHGSPLYVLTWKQWAMHSGPRICALRARARRISDNGFSLLGWPTARAEDAESSGARLSRGVADTMTAVARLAGWSTASARDWKDSPGMATSKGERSRLDQLPRQATLAGWPTATAQDASSSGAANYQATETHHSGTTLTDAARMSGPMRITADGRLLTGSTAQMDGGGQLNPAHSRWLMGYPLAWDDCGVTAMPSFRKSRRRSSARS